MPPGRPACAKGDVVYAEARLGGIIGRPRELYSDCAALPNHLVSLYLNVVIERGGRVARIVVIVIDQRECHAVPTHTRNVSTHLDPSTGTATRSRKQSDRCGGGVVPQGRSRPVILNGIWAVHEVPE